MVKTEIRAIAGFENEYNSFIERKAQLAVEIEAKKAEAVAKVDADYANYNAKLDDLIAQVSEQVEVEVPDEEPAVVEPVEEVEAVEAVEAQEQPIENLGE